MLVSCGEHILIIIMLSILSLHSERIPVYVTLSPFKSVLSWPFPDLLLFGEKTILNICVPSRWVYTCSLPKILFYCLTLVRKLRGHNHARVVFRRVQVVGRLQKWLVSGSDPDLACCILCVITPLLYRVSPVQNINTLATKKNGGDCVVIRWIQRNVWFKSDWQKCRIELQILVIYLFL